MVISTNLSWRNQPQYVASSAGEAPFPGKLPRELPPSSTISTHLQRFPPSEWTIHNMLADATGRPEQKKRAVGPLRAGHATWIVIG